MPKSSNMGANKMYKANPKPLKDPDFDKIGWDKGQMADNRDLSFALETVSEPDEPESSET